VIPRFGRTRCDGARPIRSAEDFIDMGFDSLGFQRVGLRCRTALYGKQIALHNITWEGRIVAIPEHIKLYLDIYTGLLSQAMFPE
jgi:hypothetical protein